MITDMLLLEQLSATFVTFFYNFGQFPKYYQNLFLFVWSCLDKFYFATLQLFRFLSATFILQLLPKFGIVDYR